MTAVKGKETLYICTSCNRREKQLAIIGRNSYNCHADDCNGVAVASSLYDTLDYVTNKHYPFDKDRGVVSEDEDWEE